MSVQATKYTVTLKKEAYALSDVYERCGYSDAKCCDFLLGLDMSKYGVFCDIGENGKIPLKDCGLPVTRHYSYLEDYFVLDKTNAPNIKYVGSKRILVKYKSMVATRMLRERDSVISNGSRIIRELKSKYHKSTMENNRLSARVAELEAKLAELEKKPVTCEMSTMTESTMVSMPKVDTAVSTSDDTDPEIVVLSETEEEFNPTPPKKRKIALPKTRISLSRAKQLCLDSEDETDVESICVRVGTKRKH